MRIFETTLGEPELPAPVSDRSLLNAVGRPPFAGHLL